MRTAGKPVIKQIQSKVQFPKYSDITSVTVTIGTPEMGKYIPKNKEAMVTKWSIG